MSSKSFQNASKLNGIVSVLEFGAVGNGVTDDTTAIQTAINTGKDVFLPSGTYRITGYLLLSSAFQTIYGSGQSSSLVFDSNATQYKQPAIIVSQTANDGTLRNLAINHNGANWAVNAPFVPGIFGTGSGIADARGVCLLVMADKYRVESVSVLNGWDCGIGVGNFDLATGAQSAGPDQVKIIQCHTYGNGIGKHEWGPAPGGYYHQGPGIDMLTATNFEVSNCTDFGSFDGFWCDITGGGTGSFNNCVATNTDAVIWADTPVGTTGSAAAGTQYWHNINNTNTCFTGAGSGWRKSPGGVAFYSGSYGVQFNNCTSINAALYGFVADFQSSANQFNNCRVVGSALEGCIDAGLENAWVGTVVEGCCNAAGNAAPSGSIAPASLDAFKVIGSTAGGYCNPTISDIVVKGTQNYVGQPSVVHHSYAFACRSNQTLDSNASIIGGTFVPGTSGVYSADANCKLVSFDGNGYQLNAVAINTPSQINVSTNTNSPGSVWQASNGDFNFENFANNRSIIIKQNGSGSIFFSENGVIRAKIDSTGFNIIPLASATPANNGDLLVQATSNTSLTFKLKGTDGVVRSASLTLS
jgi:hypothetical protein